MGLMLNKLVAGLLLLLALLVLVVVFRFGLEPLDIIAFLIVVCVSDTACILVFILVILVVLVGRV